MPKDLHVNTWIIVVHVSTPCDRFLVHLSWRLKCTVVNFFTFLTSPLKPLNKIQRNLTGSKNSTSSTKYVFFGPIGKTRWPSWPLIGWDIFDFSTKTTGQQRKLTASKISISSAKFVFLGRTEKRDIRPCLWLAEKFSTSPPKLLNGIQRNLTGSKTSTSSTKLVFILMQLYRQQDLNILYHVFFFFLGGGGSEKQDCRAGLWLVETLSTSLKPPNRIQRSLTRSKTLTSSTKLVFFLPVAKTRWPPWLLIGWYIFDFSSETAEWILMQLYRQQDLNILYQVCIFFGPISKQKGPPWSIPVKGGTLYSGARYVALSASCFLNNIKELLWYDKIFSFCTFT